LLSTMSGIASGSWNRLLIEFYVRVAALEQLIYAIEPPPWAACVASRVARNRATSRRDSN